MRHSFFIQIIGILTGCLTYFTGSNEIMHVRDFLLHKCHSWFGVSANHASEQLIQNEKAWPEPGAVGLRYKLPERLRQERQKLTLAWPKGWFKVSLDNFGRVYLRTEEAKLSVDIPAWCA